MKVIIKEPGQRPRVTEIENSLSALQEAVGGYIETVTFAEDCCIIFADLSKEYAEILLGQLERSEQRVL